MRKSKKGLEGDGLKDIFKTGKRVIGKLLFGDNSYPQDVVKILQKYGNSQIVNMYVVRKPIDNTIKDVINVISLNQVEENLKRTNYDKLFHLSLEVQLDNGILLKIEKNERINISKINSIGGSDCMQVNISSITLNEFLDKCKNVMQDRFYSYNFEKNNCQDFILNLLSANNCLTYELKDFMKQDVKNLFNNMPVVKNIINGITNLASKASIVMQGGDIDKPKKGPSEWNNFTRDYYDNIAKPNGISFKEMIQSNELKLAYTIFKANRI